MKVNKMFVFTKKKKKKKKKKKSDAPKNPVQLP